MKKIHIITHIDMDGACSYLTTSWFHPNCDISYTTIKTATHFRQDFLNWLLKYKVDDFDIVYILDLDCYEAKDLIDHSNVRIFDHHDSHVQKIESGGKYQNAKVIVKVYSSCSLLLYKIFSAAKPDIHISKAQKALIMLVDDYDSYTLKTNKSLFLNWVYCSYNNWFQSFIDRFYSGFTGFNHNEASMIKLVKNRILKTLKEGSYFEGHIGQYRIVATFADNDVNEIHNALLSKYNPDITLVVMPKPGRVSWRRNNNNNIEVNKFAEKFNNGGGHKYAAGGEITDHFLELVKKFEPIENEFI